MLKFICYHLNDEIYFLVTLTEFPMTIDLLAGNQSTIENETNNETKRRHDF